MRFSYGGLGWAGLAGLVHGIPIDSVFDFFLQKIGLVDGDLEGCERASE